MTALPTSVEHAERDSVRRSTTITPWVDPLVDSLGHDPRSPYVEHFWLGTLGPTATWLMRRIADGLDQNPVGFVLDLEVTARSLGFNFSTGQSNPFGRAFSRCVMFGLMQQLSSGYSVRRKLPDVARRHLARLPDAIQLAHDEWLATASVRVPGVAPLP